MPLCVESLILSGNGWKISCSERRRYSRRCVGKLAGRCSIACIPKSLAQRSPMLKHLCLLLLSVAVCCPTIYARSGSSHHSSSRSGSVYVRGYTTKNGTYVAPHTRSGSGVAAYSGRGLSHSYGSRHVGSAYVANPSGRDSHGRIKRSTAAKNAFKRAHLCPSTGMGPGSCPGYVIDHVNPLECGGADAPSNMQWQTIAEGKAKDKTERSCR